MGALFFPQKAIIPKTIAMTLLALLLTRMLIF
jgi:hypothetical protein